MAQLPTPPQLARFYRKDAEKAYLSKFYGPGQFGSTRSDPLFFYKRSTRGCNIHDRVEKLVPSLDPSASSNNQSTHAHGKWSFEHRNDNHILIF
jgi:hypothetical protein